MLRIYLYKELLPSGYVGFLKKKIKLVIYTWGFFLYLNSWLHLFTALDQGGGSDAVRAESFGPDAVQAESFGPDSS